MAESELETSHLVHVMRDMEKDFEFAIGMVFSNELEAYNKYVAYAIIKGFGVRKGSLVRNTKRKVTRRTFVCNCEGYSINSSDEEKEKKFERFDIRCGCLAHIKFKVDNNDVFEVIEYNSEHNHAFVPENQRHMIRCGRIMSETCKGVLEVACAKKLTSEEVSQIQAAIKQFYIFQMYCDDLPIWGYKGKVTNEAQGENVLFGDVGAIPGN
ncbi:hypothetical protein EUGRSUZ_I00868 [Eucalyptus grandis]|uniref:Uncharacterized protein n=2 Tax=Eucalyptus grandis TaxID=71139 RepID=A0ACC3JD90_EUCGR|nr:hypothetical protein EUGRSUZ_I00868 [Eucalyptus grandis]